MKQALIIGASGFVGSYLADCIRKNREWRIAVTKLPQETTTASGTTVYDLDILDQEAVKRLFEEVSPDYIFHLAAQSSVALSWKKPELTVNVNVVGALHVLEAARGLRKKPRILLIGSGEEYGRVEASDIPVGEETLLRPGNLYAATKACQNMLGRIYAEAYGMEVVSVRAFNHIGPRQSPTFVAADFCRQVAEIEAGKREAVIRVGNLEAKRDFTDVRDVMRAYVLLAERGVLGETYNVGSGHAVSIREILNGILSLSEADIKVQTDPERFRPVDVPVIEADIRKLTECTGWEPKIPLMETLKDTLGYWRSLTYNPSL